MSESNISSEYKDRILKGSNKGLFGILQQEINTYVKGSTESLEKKDLKRIKIDFIKRCGYARGVAKNRDLNRKKQLSSSVSQEIILEFKGKEGSGANELVPKSTSDFEY